MPTSTNCLNMIAYTLSEISLTFWIESDTAELVIGEFIWISKQYSSNIFSTHQILTLPSRLEETKRVFLLWTGASEVTCLEWPLNTWIEFWDSSFFTPSSRWSVSKSYWRCSTNFLRWMSPWLCAVTKNFCSLKIRMSVMKSSLIAGSKYLHQISPCW